MFNLVKYRYWFLIISLIIIVPGFIALVTHGLDVGIDFRGGANMELRPQRTLNADELTRALQPMKLGDLQVVTGSNTTIDAQKTVWVRLNTQVDKNVSDSITKTIQQKYGSQTTAVSTDITGTDGKPYTIVTLSNFPSKCLLPSPSSREVSETFWPRTRSKSR